MQPQPASARADCCPAPMVPAIFLHHLFDRPKGPQHSRHKPEPPGPSLGTIDLVAFRRRLHGSATLPVPLLIPGQSWLANCTIFSVRLLSPSLASQPVIVSQITASTGLSNPGSPSAHSPTP